MTFFLATLPIISILFFLFILKQPSVRASLYSLLVTGLITLFYRDFHVTLMEAGQSVVRGTLVAFIAAYVLFFGIFLFHLIHSVGGIEKIAAFLKQSTEDRLVQAMLIIVGLSPLIESSSGFGIAVMVSTPLFLAFGFSPMKATLLGLVSLLAVPWGAMATGSVIATELSDIPLRTIGTGTALISIPIFVYFIFIAAFIVGGWALIKKRWGILLLFSALFSISILVSNLFISVELAGVISSIFTAATVLFITQYKKGKRTKKQADFVQTNKNEHSLFKIVSPYLFLTILIFISRLSEPVRDFLLTYAVIDLPAFSFQLALLYSPGFWLCITCIYTMILLKISRRVVLNCLIASIKQWVPFMIATSAFISISEMMTASTMISTLASTAGVIFGTSVLVVSAFIGALGGFLTGSNTGSNAMFVQLQLQTAHQVGLPESLLIYSQNASSSHSAMASPARVMLAATLSGDPNVENHALKSISLISLGAVVLVIGLTFIMRTFV